MTKVLEVLFRFGVYVVSIWCTRFFWRVGKRYFLAKNVPNIGLIKHLWIHLIGGKEIPQILSEMPSKPLYSLFVVLVPTYVVACPKFIQKILNSNIWLNKHFVYDFFENWDQGLLTSTEQTWRKHKKLISPSFNKQRMNLFAKTFDEQTDILIDVFSKNAGVKNFRFYDVLQRSHLNTICKTTLGLDINTQGEQGKVVELFEKVLELQNYRLLHPWFHNTYLWKLSSHGRQYYHVIDKFNSIMNDEIKRAKFSRKQEEHTVPQLQKDIDLNENRSFILDDLVNNPTISEEEIRGEIHTFMTGGSETLSGVFCYLLILLGMFPEIQEKLCEELLEIFDTKGPITVEGVSKMYYSERVIKETMRIFPPIGIIGRDNAEDTELGENVIPKNSGAIINVFGLHRNPEYWPDPLKFDPDRFLPKEIAKRHPYTYLPFSLGTRMCIGYRYGILNLKMLLAKVVRKFKIFTEYKTIEEVKLTFRLLIRPKDGEKVWLKLR